MERERCFYCQRGGHRVGLVFSSRTDGCDADRALQIVLFANRSHGAAGVWNEGNWLSSANTDYRSSWHSHRDSADLWMHFYYVAMRSVDLATEDGDPSQQVGARIPELERLEGPANHQGIRKQRIVSDSRGPA